MKILAPTSGKLYPLSKGNSPIFNNGLQGRGFVIWPADDASKLVAPIGGKVTNIDSDSINIQVDDKRYQLALTGDFKDTGNFNRDIKIGDQLSQGQQIGIIDMHLSDQNKSEFDIFFVAEDEDILIRPKTVTAGEDVY
jgi:phosphotransferase system IIA component